MSAAPVPCHSPELAARRHASSGNVDGAGNGYEHRNHLFIVLSMGSCSVRVTTGRSENWTLLTSDGGNCPITAPRAPETAFSSRLKRTLREASGGVSASPRPP